MQCYKCFNSCHMSFSSDTEMALNMSKTLQWSLWGLLLLQSVNAYMTQAQVRQAMKTVRNVCIPKSGVDKEVLTKMANGEFDDDNKNLKCYLNCVLGMMQAVKGNKISMVMIKNQVAKMLEPEMGQKIVSVFESCSGATGEDNCQMAFNFAKCVYETDKEWLYQAFIVS